MHVELRDYIKMIIGFSPFFSLTEDQGTLLLDDLVVAAKTYANHDATDRPARPQKIDTRAPQFLELVYSNDTFHQASTVSEIIKAMHYCASLEIPLLLNRSGDQLEPIELGKGFTLGIQSSGTTGKPKWVMHDLERLIGPLQDTNSLQKLENDVTDRSKKALQNSKKAQAHRWLLTYHPFSFAGIQVILQCLISGNALFAFPHLGAGELAEKATLCDIDAISCTPSMFRALNLSWRPKQRPNLSTITLGGEIATQSILDEAKSSFPHAKLRHIYASTESGVLFSVKDGLEGFPEEWLQEQFNAWSISIDDGHLVLTSNCIGGGQKKAAADGAKLTRIDTGDRVKIENGRCMFIGRSDNIINVGGAKVDALSIENQIIALDSVVDARVFAKPSPIVTNVIAVEIVAEDQSRANEALKEWKNTVQSVEQPRLVNWVESIRLSDTGKKQRTEL